MKTKAMKIKSLYIVGLVAIVMGSGCNKSFLDVNTNPNSLPTSTPNYIMTNAMNVTASNMLNPNEIGQYWSGQWTQSNGYILSTTTFSYIYTNADFNYWDGYYDNLEDYQYVIENSDANKMSALKGPAKVMKAMLFQQLVDMYGDVPYSDALKGVGSLAPKFDNQKTIYEGLITLLDDAIKDIKANPFTTVTAAADITLKGNNTKWVRFANSLKLRILMHQSRIAGRDAYITTEINKIVAEGSGFVVGEDVGINPGYAPNAGQLNPIYDRWGYDATGAKRALNNYPRLTQFFVNTLKAGNDTFRLKRLGYAIGGESGANPGKSVNAEIAANYVGIPFGVSSGFLPSAASAPGPSLIVKNQYANPFIILTATEIQFDLAEAKQRYGAAVNLAGTAQSYYNEGITQSYRLLGADQSQVPALVNSGINNVDFAASTDKLAAIAIQKWIAEANFQGLEAWTEYRKSNLPVTPQSPQVVSADRPLRFYVPNTEGASNAANIPTGIDALKTRIFWDVD
jgi:hypothetical protein